LNFLKYCILYHKIKKNKNKIKVSSISKRKTHRDSELEPNHYLLKIYKKTNKIIAFIIIFPTVIIKNKQTNKK